MGRPYLYQGQLDSNYRAGPTLQKLADIAQHNRVKRETLESIFDVVAPLALTSTEAQASPASMKRASGLADLFIDWFTKGKPTIAVPQYKWKDILKTGKFKNQMELTSEPHAWLRRMEVEKALGGVPITPKRDIKIPDYVNTDSIDPDLLDQINFDKRTISEFDPRDAKKRPVYGHIYNPKYTSKATADNFGDTWAEMSQYVKDNSRYSLGDSFNPFIDRLFSSDDMSGKTSKLEQALFGATTRAEKQLQDNGWSSIDEVLNTIKKNPQNHVPYMEMWIPNEMSRLNNVVSIHNPERALSVRQLKENPNLIKFNQFKDIPF